MTSNANVIPIKQGVWDGKAPISEDEMIKRKDALELPDMTEINDGQIEVTTHVWVAVHFTLAVLIVVSGATQMTVGWLGAEGFTAQQYMWGAIMYGFQASGLIMGYILGLKYPTRGIYLSILCVGVVMLGSVVSFTSDMAILAFNQAGSEGNPILILANVISPDPQKALIAYNIFIAGSMAAILLALTNIIGGLTCPYKKELQLNAIINRITQKQAASHKIDKTIIDASGKIYEQNGALVTSNNRIHQETNLKMMEDQIEFDNRERAINDRIGRIPRGGLFGFFGMTKKVKATYRRKDSNPLKKL